MYQQFNYLWACLTLIFLTACQAATPTVQGQAPLVKQASFQTADNPKPPAPLLEHLEQKKIRFPDKVTPQELSLTVIPQFPITSSGSSSSGSSGGAAPGPQAPFVLRFVTQGQAQGRQLLMPQTGNFKLRIKPGSTFQVLDADASDGEATVQMPAGLRDVYLRSLNSQTANLVLKDLLYYVTQELVPPVGISPATAPPAQPLAVTALCSEDPDTFRLWQIDNPNAHPVAYTWQISPTQQGQGIAPPGSSYLETGKEAGDNRLTLQTEQTEPVVKTSLATRCETSTVPQALQWWKLGTRPLPVPASWHSPHGQEQVLEFTNQQAQQLTLVWQAATVNTPPLPPGVAEIGPQGGYLELPGVSELEVPPGALTQPTVLVMRQKQEVREFFDEDDTPGPDTVDIATPVELFPDGLQFAKPAYIRLKIDPEKAKGYLPSSSRYVLFPSSDIYQIYGEVLHISEGKETTSEYMTFSEWYDITHFSFIRVLVEPRNYSEDYIVNTTEQDAVMMLAASYEEPCPQSPHHNSPQYIIKWTTNTNVAISKRQAICQALLKSWGDFQHLAKGVYPNLWSDFRFQGRPYRAVPIKLRDLGNSSGLARAVNANKDFTDAELSIDPSGNIESILATTAHENYHAFQIANILPFTPNIPVDNVFSNPWVRINSATDRAWLVESSARFMGSVSAYKHHQDYKQLFTVEPNIITFLYNQTPHLETLGNSLALLQDSSLYQTPNIPGHGHDNTYYRMGVFALIHAFYDPQTSLQKIHDLNVDYIQTRQFTNEDAVQAMNRHANLKGLFPHFGSMTALKNYGLGTEQPENFNFIHNSRGNLETVSYTEPNSQIPDRSYILLPYPFDGTSEDQLHNISTLQLKHHYFESQTFSPAEVAGRPSVYVYLDQVTADKTLNPTQAENLLGNSTWVHVLANPAPADNWKNKKPLLAQVRLPKDNKLVEGKFPLQKLRWSGLNRSVYGLQVPIPEGDDKIRLLISVANSYLTPTSDKVDLRYKLKLFMGPRLLATEFLNTDEDPSQTHIAFTCMHCDPQETRIQFTGRNGHARILSDLATWKSSSTDDEGNEIHTFWVVRPLDADDGGPVSVFSGELEGTMLANSASPCYILPYNADYQLAASHPCKKDH